MSDKAPRDAATLANEAYTSERFYRLECERLFARTWMLAGLTEDFVDPATVRALTLAGVPIILATGTDGCLRGFQNVCRHRGARLVNDGCANSKVLTCPYHNWSYDLKGRVLARPHYFGSNRHDAPADENAPGLIPVQVGIWHHWVFVNIDNKAPALEEHMRFADSLLGGYHLGELSRLETLEFEVPANWKLTLENFWEPNHSFTIHPQLMKAGTADRRAAVQWAERVVYGSVPYSDTADPEAMPGRSSGAPIAAGQTSNRVAWIMQFPNLCLTSFPGNLAIIEVQPLGPEKTLERLHVYASNEVATLAEHENTRQEVVDLWRETNEQDVNALRWLQAGRHCPGFDGGALSPYWDGAVSSFAQFVNDGMRAGD